MQFEKSKYRNQKGFSLLDFPDKFVCIDLETTGFSPEYDEIIEIAALKVENGKITDKFLTPVCPTRQISEYITSLTGITNEMVSAFPKIDVLLPKLIDFIGDYTLVGHNVSFDVNFIYDNYLRLFGKYFRNSYIDTMRLSRILYPKLFHHRLKDLVKLFNIDVGGSHRACYDCGATLMVYVNLQNSVIEKFGTIEEFRNIYYKNRNKKKATDLRTLVAQTDEIDTENPFYGKNVVFTGALEKMVRTDAAQLIVNLGGNAQNDITKKTDYLILGNLDYCKSIKDGKSSKHKKAENFNLKGCNIVILPENAFYDMILEDYEEEEEEKSNIPTNILGIDVSVDESKALSILEKIFMDENLNFFDKIKLQRRTDKYLTVCNLSGDDFLRLKMGVKSKWFSVDIHRAPADIRKDTRLNDVNNKNQRHWIIKIDSIDDLIKYSDIILYSFVYALTR